LKKAGIAPKWKILKIGNEPYTYELLKKCKNGKENYNLTFQLPPQRPTVPKDYGAKIITVLDKKWWCSECEIALSEYECWYRCDECNFDLCMNCQKRSGSKDLYADSIMDLLKSGDVELDDSFELDDYFDNDGIENKQSDAEAEDCNVSETQISNEMRPTSRKSDWFSCCKNRNDVITLRKQ